MIKKIRKIFYFTTPIVSLVGMSVVSSSCNNDRKEAIESLYEYRSYVEENIQYFKEEILNINITKDNCINIDTTKNKLENFNFEYLLCTGNITVKKNLYSFNGHNYRIEINPRSQSIPGTNKATIFLNITDTNLDVKTTSNAIEIEGFKVTSVTHNHYTYDYKIRDCEACKRYN